MARLSFLLSGCALAACAVPVFGQSTDRSPYGQPQAQPGYVNPFAPMTDADQLAQQLRVVAANPTDLYALLSAARLALKVGDTDAAAALYTRANRLNTAHPQVKAGTARLLVQSGRPGEALRRFQEAERLGASLNDFGADRALAYDLVGEQQRAQREYRALLRVGSDDETTRRYALSLGISGLKEPALALLEPLNRRGDRGAWRARAFVLAMTGDRSGAEKIATTMMPSGMAKGLEPFFDRLPRLSATERAFAVNFGETRASPTRLADARLVPMLPALSPEPDPFARGRATTQLAARNDDDGNDRGKRKKRKSKRERAEEARVASAPYVAPLPAPPAPTAAQLASLSASRAYGGYRTAPTRGPTVLPPPADAYRDPVTRATTRMAANPASAAADDEPDFAVAAVAKVASQRPALAGPSAAPVAAPPVAPTTAAPSRTALAAATPSAARTLAPATPVATPPRGSSLASASVAPGLGDFSLTGTTARPGASVPPPTAAPTGAAPAASLAALPPAAPATSNPVAAGVPATAAPSNGLASVPPPSATNAGSVAATTTPPPPTTPQPGAVQPASTPPVASLATADPASTIPAGAIAPLAAGPPKAITAATGAPPAPTGASGDAVLAAIIAAIQIPDAERTATPPTASEPVSAPASAPVPSAPAVVEAPRPTPPVATGTKLPTNLEKKVEATERTAPKPDASLPRKDARGRFVDARGRPLLDARGRPMDAKAAAAWKAEQSAPIAAPAGSLPRKDARGRFVDDKGKPLFDARGRPMDAKAAAAWKADQAADDAPPTGRLPRKDARGRFVDDKGKPLLDARGRPMDAKAAAAWKAEFDKNGGIASRDLPTRDARGRFVDDKGKPLLDRRGRPMDAKAAAAWKADADRKPDPAKGEPARIWVQVAGGADEGSLGREWSRLSAATPSLKGKQGWTTPLRATNRILTGPFKTTAEATALVNRLKKEGVSGFVFSSDAGQKITRLGAK